MDTCMHKTMASIASLGKIEIIRSQEFMRSEARLNFLKKKRLFQGLKLPFWGLNFVEFWCWGLNFGGQGGPHWIRPCIEPLNMYHSTTDKQPFNLSVPLTYALT